MTCGFKNSNVGSIAKESSKAAEHDIFFCAQIFRHKCLSKVNLRHWISPFRWSIQDSNKAVYICCVRSRSNCFSTRQATQARFKQALVFDFFKFFWPLDIINFPLNFLSIITSVQSKQIHSFHELQTHTRSNVFGRSGTDNFRHSTQGHLKVTWDTSCRSRHSSLLTRNENENPSNETSRPLATSSLARPRL